MAIDHDGTTRIGAYASVAGAVTMLVGAALWGASGTDLWEALDSGDMAGYLIAAAGAKPLLVANLSFWILGVLMLGVAGASLSGMCKARPAAALVALVCYRTGVPLAIVSFIAMMSLVVQIGSDTSAAAIQVAAVVGWMGARADDLATALIIGGGPFCLSLAGRGEWAPNWLVCWGYLSGIAGLFSIFVLYLSGLSAYGIVIVPIGIGWMLAAGIALLRRGA